MTTGNTNDDRNKRVAFALFLTTIIAPIFGWLYAGGWGAVLAFVAWVVCVTLPRTTGVRLSKFLHGFVSADQLPLTMVNITLAILVGSMAFGVDVAFYAAMIGVPIVVLTLMVIALDPGPYPESEFVPVPVDPKKLADNARQ
ncbi:hypothetical protein [Aminobacter sp. AP02]|uniref:hypothetical protein n=1 Tax=Aminobacter sp. AP02 TaxID=2135737 RepID=UPI000D6CDCE1|nr:hypothetical protein [Aminobacter sp. AP02]PWK74057.1 hypothetical protein C8K44_104229 [Aminobacter sp. AP02]